MLWSHKVTTGYGHPTNDFTIISCDIPEADVSRFTSNDTIHCDNILFHIVSDLMHASDRIRYESTGNRRRSWHLAESGPFRSTISHYTIDFS